MKTNSISAGLLVHARTITTTRQLLFRAAWLWTSFLAFATIAFAPQPAQAAVIEAWVQRYSNIVSNTTDEAVKVVRDAAGDIIVTGSTAGGFPAADADMLTIKYSGADGSVLWQQRYNGPANGHDQPSALAVDGSGNVVVTGSSEKRQSDSPEIYTAKYAATDGALLWERRGPEMVFPFPAKLAVDGNGNVVVTGHSANGTNRIDCYTAKYAAADGALLWEKRYNGPANSADYPKAVAVDGNGNVVVTGNSDHLSGHSDFYTVKYAAADGALLWDKRYGAANGYGQATALAVDGSGNVVVTGSSYVTAKYAAADGALLWEKRYNGSANGEGQPSALAVDGSGNVVVTGYSFNTNNMPDYYTAKYAAADGALLWEKRHGPGCDRCVNAVGVAAVAVDGSGNVVVTGGSSNGTNPDYYTAKYAAADGALLWEKRYNGPADRYDSANAVTVDGSGNVVVTGQTDAVWGMGTIGGDYYTAKYAAADGALLWEKRHAGSAPNDASAQAVAVDGSGNVVVTGVAYNWSGFQSDGDYYTAKYAAANGALLWEKRYNGPANGEDQPSALAVDGSGNVVVTGYSDNGTNSYWDYYTAKYAAADGALLWEKRYNGPANGLDRPSALAVDGSGNVVVTGSSDNGTNSYWDYTAKYAAADGALLWEKRYNGGGGTALAVDGSGNVVVTGSSHGTNSHSDYYTAKYAAADGALLWEKRYNGPANHEDHANAVAVDGSGNVVVTGTSWNGEWSFDSDYYTAKYAAADGALLWEKRYIGPANSSDFASAVAVDGSGNVVVTGSSDGDYYTAKYASANGALLWEKRYNGPANSGDGANAVAVDGSGNVIVTGNSWGGNTTVDYYTAKYASADGGLLWEKRFTGPASVGNVGDSSHCLALGPDSMVAVTGSSLGRDGYDANAGYATVVYRDLPAVSIDLIPTGVRLRVTGLPGRSYNIERTPAVTGPWSTINTQTAPASGLFEYLDPNPPSAAAFYRTSEP